MTVTQAEPNEHTQFEISRGLLLSVRPRHAAAILAGTKTVELRRRAPRVVDGATVVLYASGAVRAVVGTVQISTIQNGSPQAIWERFHRATGITRSEFDTYFTGTDTAYALVLSAPMAAPSPMHLIDLRRHDLEPPQSWRYLTRAFIHKFRAALGVCDDTVSALRG